MYMYSYLRTRQHAQLLLLSLSLPLSERCRTAKECDVSWVLYVRECRIPFSTCQGQATLGVVTHSLSLCLSFFTFLDHWCTFLLHSSTSLLCSIYIQISCQLPSFFLDHFLKEYSHQGSMYTYVCVCIICVFIYYVCVCVCLCDISNSSYIFHDVTSFKSIYSKSIQHIVYYKI